MSDLVPTIDSIINEYNRIIKGIDQTATEDQNRAYGGVIRSSKGTLVEGIAGNIIKIAWSRIAGDLSRISFAKNTVRIPMKKEYINRIHEPDVRNWLNNNYTKQHYTLKTDVHVSIDDSFVVAVECKAYTENAMLKRILVDFTLFKTQFPDLNCVLLQLESQLTGDYSQIDKSVIYGSSTTLTLLSYFDVDLRIITLLEGERKVYCPIHKKEYFKELTEESVERAIQVFMEILKPYL